MRATDAAANLSAYSNVATATTATGQAQMYFIEPDHLNTPRMISSQAGATVWRWDQAEPFGNSVPNSDADGDGIAFEFPMRFPGQYFDRETGLAYNAMRDYDSSIGRYVESDSTGLRAGLNTYLYVNGNPLVAIDELGLYALKAGVPPASPQLGALLGCMEILCGSFVVTATTNDHPAQSPHGRGLAADVGYPSDPGGFLCCASKCGAGFGLDELKHPSPGSTTKHIHIQIPPGRRGGRGDLPPPTCGPDLC